jgi:muramidase (phage lysozyme)
VAKTTDTRRSAWNKTYSTYLSLNQRLSQAQPQERDALERAVAAQQDALLDLPAPSIAAVILKLETIWEGQLHGLDQEAEERRLVLEDLQDLSSELADLVGARH